MAAEFIAASAAVLMVPSIQGFKKKLEIALSTVDAQVKVGLTLDKASVSKVEAEVAAFKQAAEKGSVKTQLELDVKQAEARLTELRIQEQARKLGIKVEVDTKQADLQLRLLRAEAEARAIKMRLEVDTDGVKKEFEKLTNGLGEAGSGFKKALTLNLQVIGLSQLPAVGLALASVTQSMVALGQSALLLPGILSGVASSFATLLVGVSGIKAAFTAYGTAVKDSAQDAQRAKDATRALDNANRDLTTATRDAKRSLEDLNQQMRGQPLDEASAVLDLRDAQIQLADSFGKTGLQRQRDQIAEQRAQQNLDNVRVRGTRLVQDATQANKDGVAGNPAVLDALDRQAKAVEGLATASKGGTAIAAALKNLSPNAQDFVIKVESMRGSWTDFKKSVSDKLFAGLGDEVVALGSKLPVVEKGFTGIASALNNNVKTALKTLSSDQNVGFFDRIFGNTADAQGKLSGALKPLIDGFVHLGAVGSDFLPRMVDGFAKLLERFNGFIDAADKDGRLKTWIETGIQAVKDLGNSFLNIVSIIGSVAQAFTGGGGQSFLGLLETGTKRLADFLKSADGQDKLQKFFHDARESFNEWLPVIKNIFDAIKNVVQAGKDWSDVLRPFLSETASLLKDHAGLAQTVLSAYLAWKTISPVIKTIEALLSSNLLSALNKVRVAVGEGEGFKGKLGALSGFMTGAFTVAATGLALFIAGSFVQAFAEGGDEMSRMKTKADELATSLDQVTGAATKASAAVVSQALQNGTNSVTNEKYGDLRQVAKDRGIDPGVLTRATAAGDRGKVDELLAATRASTRDEVAKSKFYKENQTLIDANGGLDMLVAALNGDPAAVATFTKVSERAVNDSIPGPDLSSGQLRGLERSGLATITDLADIKGTLSPATQQNINLSGTVNEQLNNAVAGQSSVQATNSDKNGAATLKPGNPFGPGATVGVTDSGGISVHVPGPANPTLEANVRNGGGDVDNTTLGGSTYTLTRERAALYANLPKFATGGQAMGAGSGKSDSILARVSNGEFITRADQVAKNPALFHGLNSGAIDPRSLPGFDGGGLASVSGKAMPPEPIIKRNGFLGGQRASFGDSWNQIKTGIGGVWGNLTGAGGVGQGGVQQVNADGTVSPMNAPAKALDNKGPGYSLNPFDAANVNAQLPTGASQRQHLGKAPYVAPVDPRNPGNFPRGSFPIGDIVGKVYDPVTGDYTDPKTGIKLSNKLDLPGAPKPGPPAVKPGIFSPGNTNPGLNSPGTAVAPPTAADFFPGPGKVPIPHLGTGAPPGPGVPTPEPLASVIPGVPAMPDAAGLPANLQPLGIMQSIGSVLLDAILGFLGINPQYITTLKQGLGLVGGGLRHRADPGVDQILGNQPAMDAAVGPLTGQQGTFTDGQLTAAGRATQMAEQMKGKMYAWGGNTLDGTDCSGLVMYIADAYMGREFAGRTGGTGGFSTSLPAKGAIIVSDPSELPPGTLQVGWNSSHTSGTLPDGRGFEANDFGIPIHLGPGAGGAKEKGFTNWAYFPAQPAPGFAAGGMLSGPGSGTSDSILARVSHGEFITKASQVAKNPGLFHGLNSGAIDPRSLPAFAVGGEAGGGLADVKRNPDGSIPTKSKGGGSWTPPKTVQPLPSVAKGERAAIGAAPQEKHSLGAVDQGIDGAATAIGNAASMAASAATMGMGGGGAMGSLIGGATQIGAGLAKGIANIGSSLLVGTVTGGTTAGAYGSPVLPQKSQQEPQGPRIVNQYGDIHTASYDEFYKGQQRREQQQQAPYINSLRK